VNRLLGVRGLERPDALREPGFEREIVGEPAEQSLTEVDVRLDETGKYDKPRAIDRRCF